MINCDDLPFSLHCQVPKWAQNTRLSGRHTSTNQTAMYTSVRKMKLTFMSWHKDFEYSSRLQTSSTVENWPSQQGPPWGVDLSPSETYKIKVISPRPQVTGAKCYAYLHLSFMGSLQAHIGCVGINTMDTAESTRFPRSRLQGQRSQDQTSMPMHIYQGSTLAVARLPGASRSNCGASRMVFWLPCWHVLINLLAQQGILGDQLALFQYHWKSI